MHESLSVYDCALLICNLIQRLPDTATQMQSLNT